MFAKKMLFTVLIVGAVLLAPQAVSRAGGPLYWWWRPISELNNDVVNHPDQVNPAVAYNTQQGEYMVVWQNEWDSNQDIFGRIVPKDGIAILPWFPVSPAGHQAANPDVAYGSKLNQYLVVYEADHDINGYRISATGQFIGGSFAIATGGIGSCSEPAVAYAETADRYLVVWQYSDSFGRSIWARAYKSDGTAEGAAFAITPHDTAFPEQPDLAYNSARDEFLVVWEQLYGTSDHDVHGGLVQMTGGASLVSSGPILYTSYAEITPAVAAIPQPAGVGQYLVVCEREEDIYGHRVAGTGALEGLTISISTLAGNYESEPTVAGNRSGQADYLVAWKYEDANQNIRAQEVSSGGSLLGQSTLLNAWYSDNPDLASGPQGDYLLVMDDWLMSNLFDVFGKVWGTRMHLPLVIKD